jgi:hypothetical protein
MFDHGEVAMHLAARKATVTTGMRKSSDMFECRAIANHGVSRLGLLGIMSRK